MNFFSRILCPALLFLPFFFSCESSDQDWSVSPSPHVGDTVNFRLEVQPSLEVEAFPMGRNTPSGGGLYAINVFWRGGSLSTYHPYASGLFDDPTQIELGLLQGYVYRFDCYHLPKSVLPNFGTEEEPLYGLPLSPHYASTSVGRVTNRLRLSLADLTQNECFYQHIYKGRTLWPDNTYADHREDITPFYGSIEVDCRSEIPQGSSILSLKPAFYTLRFAAKGLDKGDSLRIESRGMAPFYLVGYDSSLVYTSETGDRLLSMYEVATLQTGQQRADEYLRLDIYYYSAAAGLWRKTMENALLRVRRHHQNVVNVVDIDRLTQVGLSIQQEWEGGDELNTEELSVGQRTE